MITRRKSAVWLPAMAVGLLAAGCASASVGAAGTTATGPAATASPAGARQPGGLLWFQTLQMTSAATGWALAGTGGPAASRAQPLSLVRTADGARTWTVVTPAAARPMLATPDSTQVLDPAGGGRASLAVTASAQQSVTAVNTTAVFTTADGGRTWTRSAPLRAPGSVTAVSFAGPAHGWLLMEVGTGPSGKLLPWLYRTADGGRHWSPAAIVPPGTGGPSLFCQQQGLDFVTATTGWVTSDCRGLSQLMVSGDGGGTWAVQPLPIPARTCSGVPCFISGPRFTGGTGFLTVAPEGGTPFFMTSSDHGRTWRVRPLPAGAMTYPQITFFSPVSGVLVAAGAQERIGSVFYTTGDGGRTWTPVRQGIRFTALGATVEFASPRAGFVWTLGGGSGGTAPPIEITANSGRTWTSVIPRLAG